MKKVESQEKFDIIVFALTLSLPHKYLPMKGETRDNGELEPFLFLQIFYQF